jgi:transcriptional regulator with XRE-family HTH domain
MLKNDQYIASIRKNVGGNLRRLRRGRGLSQSSLAEMASLNRSYLSMVENGRRNISLDNLVALALALCVEPVELLMGAEAAAEPAE